MVKNEKEGILLESGTNEIEVMKFTVLGEFYGINVAKVQEIIMSEKVKPMPHANPAVEGIFKPRDELITVINLAKYLTGDDFPGRQYRRYQQDFMERYTEAR